MPTPWSATMNSIHGPTARDLIWTTPADLAVLDRVLDEVADRRHELALIAGDRNRLVAFEPIDGDLTAAGDLGDAFERRRV